MSAQEPHILVVTVDDGDEYPTYRLECPGVSDVCRMWRPCPECANRGWDEELADDGEAHGVEHQWIQAEWMFPTPHCLAAMHDALGDAGSDVSTAPGRYPVHVTFEDEGEFLVLEAAADAAEADL